MKQRRAILAFTKYRAYLIGGAAACLAIAGVAFGASQWLRSGSDKSPADISVTTNAPSLTFHTDQSISALAHEIYASHKLAPAIVGLGDVRIALNADENDELRKAIAALARQHSPRAEKAIADLHRGDLNPAINLFAELAKKAEAAGPDAAKEAAGFYSSLGALAAFDNNEEATRVYTKALKLSPQMADVWNQLGRLQLWAGDLTEAEKSYSQVLTLGDHLHDQTSVGRTLGNLGTIAQARGNLDRAKDFVRRALAINEALGHKKEVSNNLMSLGNIASQQRDFNAAETFYKRVLAIDEVLDRKQGIAVALSNLGDIAQKQHKLDTAEDFFKRALIIFEVLGGKVDMAMCLTALGTIANERGDTPKARELWTQARGLYSQSGNQDMVATFDGWLPAPKSQ
tara:strand:+ start:472 stop:1671 length:1200 start_codon:yes stop_codon:yes gene_type:complete